MPTREWFATTKYKMSYEEYYNREYGYSKLNKILDKKIIQEFKFLEKQGIMREVRGK